MIGRSRIYHEPTRTSRTEERTYTLPPALFQEAVHYIEYLSQKAQSAYFKEMNEFDEGCFVKEPDKKFETEKTFEVKHATA